MSTIKYNLIRTCLLVTLMLILSVAFVQAQTGAAGLAQTDNLHKGQMEPDNGQPGNLQSAPIANRMDSVEISLITCEPHEMIYALYGHTGIRVHDFVSGDDFVANWGIFDQSQKFFILRFTFGLTDYCMGIETWEGFKERYNFFNCGIREQVLNLTIEEKQRILQAIFENYRPENRYYRYNFFYDNCTTRARDIIAENLDGKISYNNDPWVSTSFREEIHQWNGHHRWARWGNDFLLGIGADKPTDREQQQFLPDTLRVDFDNATVTSDGVTRKLVKEEHWATPSQYDYNGNRSWEQFLEPWALGFYSLALLALIEIIEVFKLKRRIWQFDVFLLLLSGIPGMVLTAMIFSQHPTVNLNFQILVFNPLALVFGWKIIKSLRKNEGSRYMLWLGLMALAGFIASYQQTFAEGVRILAFVLFLRYFSTSILNKKNEKK